MPVVGLVINSQKPRALEIAGEMAKWLAAKGVDMGIPLTEVTELVCSPPKNLDNQLKDLDWVVVLGGDGTLLNTARLVAPYGIPVLGVNLGRLGFLTEVEEDCLFDCLDRLIKKDYHIEERMMLQADVLTNQNGQISSFYALNDIVVTKGAFARMISLQAYMDDDLIGTYSADGLLVASPTGSTAYSLSAGGPLLTPDIKALIVTPICSHAMDTRPLVLAEHRQIQIKLLTRNVDVTMTVDGHSGIPIGPEDRIIIKKAPVVTKLIRFSEYKFFHILREKMRRGR